MQPENKSTGNGKSTKDDRHQWIASLEYFLGYILKNEHSEQASLLVEELSDRLRQSGHQDSVHGQHALYQYDPAGKRATLSRQPGNRAAHQELCPLERHGDGGQSQSAACRYRRPYFHLRIAGDAVRSRPKSFFPR